MANGYALRHGIWKGGRDRRRSIRRGVAPLNANPKWPEEYVAVLWEAGALEKSIPPSPTSPRPSREHDKPVAAKGHPVRKTTARLSAPYQTQRAPVKAVAGDQNPHLRASRRTSHNLRAFIRRGVAGAPPSKGFLYGSYGTLRGGASSREPVRTAARWGREGDETMLRRGFGKGDKNTEKNPSDAICPTPCVRVAPSLEIGGGGVERKGSFRV